MTTPRNRAAVQLAQEVAALLLRDLPDAVAERVNDDFSVYTEQGWHMELVHPAWSGSCWHGDHGDCDGTATASLERYCPHHSGKPIPEFRYRLRLDEDSRVHAEPRTKPHPRLRRKGPA